MIQKKTRTITTFVSVNEIQKYILPMSKKNIRKFLYRYLPVKKVGSRLYVNRAELEALLNDHDRTQFPLEPIEEKTGS